MRGRLRAATWVLVIGTTLTGCEFTQSSNPLSPSVAGPIPGVAITQPKPLEPIGGFGVTSAQQPVELLFESATTNGERPIWHEIQVSTDSGFAGQPLYTATRVQPGEGGRTKHRLPDPLGAGHTYYWRVRAVDGANTGPYSAVANFQVLVPIVIEAPVPVSPRGGETTSTNSPDFVVTNATVSGPAGSVAYRFQVANDAAFTSVAAVVTVPRSTASTTTMSLGTLPYDRMFFWRVMASDGVVDSAWSPTQSFKTPAPPPPPAPTPRPPTPSPSPSPTPPGRGPRRPPNGPLPDASAIVRQVAAEFPGALANSCQEHGGSWDFMDLVVDRLRAVDDTRWGYNWKRGFHQGYSQDVIDYNWGSGEDEGSTQVYIIDIIQGHCGSNPSPTWSDVTPAGAGRWTSRGRF